MHKGLQAANNRYDKQAYLKHILRTHAIADFCQVFDAAKIFEIPVATRQSLK